MISDLSGDDAQLQGGRKLTQYGGLHRRAPVWHRESSECFVLPTHQTMGPVKGAVCGMRDTSVTPTQSAAPEIDFLHQSLAADILTGVIE